MGCRDNARLDKKGRKQENLRHDWTHDEEFLLTVHHFYNQVSFSRPHRCWRRQRRPSTGRSTQASCCWRRWAGCLCCLSRKWVPLRRCSRRSSSPPARRYRRGNSADLQQASQFSVNHGVRLQSLQQTSRGPFFPLTIAEATLATLMGSPLLVIGISDLSMMYRQASRTP